MLGVLHNVRQDYEAAVSCFQQARTTQPDDYSLLNKVSGRAPFLFAGHDVILLCFELYSQIGATMANSSRSMEAISYYEKMLSLRPRYARGWLNVGIAHTNNQQYDLAVRAYLKALSLSPTARCGEGNCCSRILCCFLFLP